MVELKINNNINKKNTICLFVECGFEDCIVV